MREKFIEQSFYAGSVTLINQANEIAQEYVGKGYSLTLRQLYYQFVARGFLKNTVPNYKRLGDIVNKARQAGLIDWDLIIDRTRWLRSITDYPDPENFIQSMVSNYAENLWRNNATYCEVWVEKDALSGVVARACDKWRVPYFPCRGYASQSEVYAAGKRIQSLFNENYDNIVIYHLGDHDPSGIDMTRDNRERLEMFSRVPLTFTRIALNMDQVEEYNPPENPAKETDSRFFSYEDRFGSSSWELDSMPPEVINEILEKNITAVLDVEEWQRLYEEEQDNRSHIQAVADDWDKVVKRLDEPDSSPYSLGIPAKRS